ncbi:TlpA disulfide reductase family protein [Dactylosporangium sp. NPDC049742]|uniref:TlpA family protein disulfide reductase n=1 Tax=Dactylosporangium sp. NPDC049742 TaxID=3154737 RepID=UPI0034440E4E
MLPAGSAVEEYAATTLDGATVSSGDAGGVLLVGFFSIGCTHCTTQLPKFAERARGHAGGRDLVLAVVVADETQDPKPYVGPLTGVARVVHEGPAGPVAHAFGVTGFPAMGLVDPDGTVRASGSQVTALPQDAPSARVAAPAEATAGV